MVHPFAFCIQDLIRQLEVLDRKLGSFKCIFKTLCNESMLNMEGNNILNKAC